eukprot:14397668-Ditylum_brightwellii.AAC.1
MAGATLASLLERRRKITDGFCPKSTVIDMAPKYCASQFQVSGKTSQGSLQRQQKAQNHILATETKFEPGNQNHTLLPIPEHKTDRRQLATSRNEFLTKSE